MIPKEVKDHLLPGVPAQLKIEALDEPGAGGAYHLYEITGLNSSTNESCPYTARYGAPADHTTILFQNGPIPEKDANGVTVEALLAVSMHRLKAFQAGPFGCRENALAITKIEEALLWLNRRTLDRMQRGVEGKNAS